LTPEVVERTFIEIITAFPTEKHKKVLGKAILTSCSQKINQTRIILSKQVNKKFILLNNFLQVYKTDEIIIL
jgi:hypothetical protein